MIISKKLSLERIEEIKNFPVTYDKDCPKLATGLVKIQKSPLENIPCITAEIATQEIAELIRESRSGIDD